MPMNREMAITLQIKAMSENLLIGFIGEMARRLRLVRYLRDTDGCLMITIILAILFSRCHRVRVRHRVLIPLCQAHR